MISKMPNRSYFIQEYAYERSYVSSAVSFYFFWFTKVIVNMLIRDSPALKKNA